MSLQTIDRDFYGLEDEFVREFPVVTKLMMSGQEDGVTVEEEGHDQGNIDQEISHFFGTGWDNPAVSPTNYSGNNINLQQLEQLTQQQQQQKLVTVDQDHEKDESSQFSISSCTTHVLTSLPIGLKLTITESFMDKLPPARHDSANDKVSSPALKINNTTSNSASTDDHESLVMKKRAANFPISTIEIGEWKRSSRHEGDVVAKCYYKKQKLVWEALDGNLEAKIEFPWSDIIAIRATLLPSQPGILELMLNKIPLFFQEINPTPRKHTNWRASSDFTNGQATLFRKHRLEFAPGVLDKHYNDLLHSDKSLLILNSQPFPDHASPYFYVPSPAVIQFSPPPPVSPHPVTSSQNNCQNLATPLLMNQDNLDGNIFENGGYGGVIDKSRMRIYPDAATESQVWNGNQVDNMVGNNQVPPPVLDPYSQNITELVQSIDPCSDLSHYHEYQQQQWPINNHQDQFFQLQGIGGEEDASFAKQPLITDDNNYLLGHDYFPTELLTPPAATFPNQINPSITMDVVNMAAVDYNIPQSVNPMLNQFDQMQGFLNGNQLFDYNINDHMPPVDHTMEPLHVDNQATLDHSMLLQQPPINYSSFSDLQSSEHYSTSNWMMNDLQQAPPMIDMMPASASGWMNYMQY